MVLVAALGGNIKCPSTQWETLQKLSLQNGGYNITPYSCVYSHLSGFDDSGVGADAIPVRVSSSSYTTLKSFTLSVGD